jgi:phosphate transport system substrate-binding protein
VSATETGCSGLFDSPTTRRPSTSARSGDSPLHIATAALASPIARAATLWNGNHLPTNDEYSGSLADDLGSEGPGFAGYFGRRHGFTPTKEPLDPPFRVTVSHADQSDAREALSSGSVGITEFGGEVGSTIADRLDVSAFVRHDLFRMGQVIVVSEELYDAGVTAITSDELLGIYNGRLTNWQSVGGPDGEIYLVGTVDISGGPERFDRTFLEGQPLGGADQLYGRTGRKVSTVSDRDDTVARIPLPDVESLRSRGTDDYRVLDIEVDGDPRGPGGTGYPGTYPIPLFTEGAPDPREAAFLDALSAEVVQPRILDTGDRLAVFPAATDADS